MKVILLSFFACLTYISMNAQNSFSDDFETYNVGGLLGSQSSNWRTWTGSGGGADDIAISNTDAHSGSKSIYFTSTSSSGGPSDIVLPFGGVRTDGNFEFTSWLKLPTGKAGYFNFQGSQTMGNIYALSTFFGTNGTMQIYSSTQSVLTATYPQGSWFEYKLVANLNSNTWELFINNVSKGTFQLNDLTIYAVDFFARLNNQFWVDDVSYNYTPYVKPALNAALSLLNVKNGIVSLERTPEVTIRNLGNSTITSFDLNLTANGTTTTQSFTGLNITSGSSYEAPFSKSFVLATGLNTVTVSVSNVNGQSVDDDATDDSKTVNLTPIVAGANKIVVAEEATGTWCGWCPRGAVMMDNMTENYKGFFQGIAVHNGDPMAISTYDGKLPGVTGYPSALTDRGTAKDPSNIENDFKTRIILTPVAKLTNGAKLANTTLDVSVSTQFTAAASGNYKLACVLVEDSVTGTSAGYSQSNYYSGGSKGKMGGYESLPNPVPASQMRYDHVAREIQPSVNGINNAFGSSMNNGDVFVHNFSFDISAWKKDYLHIVSLLIAPDGSIENAGTATVSEAIDNGFVLSNKGLEKVASRFLAYPNPAKDEMNLQVNAKSRFEANIRITDVTGKVIMSSNREFAPGTNILPIQITDLASGSYLILISVGDEIETLTFTKE